MHTAWIRSKCGLDACPMCNDEHNNPNNPKFRQIDLLTVSQDTVFPIPCKIHGDPAVMLPGNEQAFDVYLMLNKSMNFLYRVETHGEKDVTKCYLDLNACKIACEACDADLKETLPKLQIIHREIFN